LSKDAFDEVAALRAANKMQADRIKELTSLLQTTNLDLESSRLYCRKLEEELTKISVPK
jgi:hypothetical protein